MEQEKPNPPTTKRRHYLRVPAPKAMPGTSRMAPNLRPYANTFSVKEIGLKLLPIETQRLLAIPISRLRFEDLLILGRRCARHVMDDYQNCTKQDWWNLVIEDAYGGLDPLKQYATHMKRLREEAKGGRPNCAAVKVTAQSYWKVRATLAEIVWRGGRGRRKPVPGGHRSIYLKD